MTGFEKLSEEQAENLMKRYYDGERIPDLIAEFGLNVSTGRLYKLFPPLVSESHCPWCDEPMICDRPSRSGSPPTPRCAVCGHVQTGRCRCQTCVERERQLAEIEESQNRRELIASYNRRRKLVRDPDSLSVRERVVLAAFLRGNRSEDPIHIAPLDSVPTPITPGDAWTRELLSGLVWDSALLVINPHSDLVAFAFPEGKPWTYFSLRVWYELNVDPRDESVVHELLHPEPRTSDDPEVDDLLAFWREIAVQEVIQYLRHMVQKFRLKFRVGPKTKATIEHLLDNYSTAQTNGFVWSAVKNAAALAQSREMNLGHSSNTIPGSMRRSGDRYLANGWEAKNFGRDFNCPQSVISSTFFNSIIRVGDDGFNMPMHEWAGTSTTN